MSTNSVVIFEIKLAYDMVPVLPSSQDPRDPNWAPAHPDPMPMYRAPPLFKSQISNLKANLSALPIECLENVAHFLDGNDLLNLGATCIRLLLLLF
jgi:hypothetical protein